MNVDVIKGKWNQMRGDLKARWAQITDDEWTQIAGDKDKMIGKLQERYGRSREEIAREVEAFFNQREKQISGQGQQGGFGQPGGRNTGSDTHSKPGDRQQQFDKSFDRNKKKVS